MISKQILILSVFSFCSMFCFAQNAVFDNNGEKVILLKDNSLINPGIILFKTDSNLYFSPFTDDNFYKIALTLIDGNVDCEELNSSKFSSYLLKFVKQSQAGITLSILGTAGSVLMPFVVNNVAILVVPPVISLTGFIIWATSYSHLKKYGIIESAIEYK